MLLIANQLTLSSWLYTTISMSMYELSNFTVDKFTVPRVHNNKSVQLPYGFYTRHLDGMT